MSVKPYARKTRVVVDEDFMRTMNRLAEAFRNAPQAELDKHGLDRFEVFRVAEDSKKVLYTGDWNY